MSALQTFTKDNYGRQVPLIHSMIQTSDLLGALEHEVQNKVTGLEEIKPVTAERQSLHTKIVKDPDTDNTKDPHEYKMKETKYRKWKEKQTKEALLKDVIFAALPGEYQDLMKSDLKIAQHQFASLTDILKFIDKSFGTTTAVDRRREKKNVLPSLPLPTSDQTGEDMLRTINATLHQYKEKHLAKMKKAEQEIHLADIILDAVDNTPEIKSKFYAHDEYGEKYEEICSTLACVYKNIQMTSVKSVSSANSIIRQSIGRSTTRDRSNSRSTSRSRSNLKSGKSESPRRANSPKKYCDYHQTECNHSTEQCYKFKAMVIKNRTTVSHWLDDRKTSYSAQADYDNE
jgi:hypothetical protein